MRTFTHLPATPHPGPPPQPAPTDPDQESKQLLARGKQAVSLSWPALPSWALPPLHTTGRQPATRWPKFLKVYTCPFSFFLKPRDSRIRFIPEESVSGSICHEPCSASRGPRNTSCGSERTVSAGCPLWVSRSELRSACRIAHAPAKRSRASDALLWNF